MASILKETDVISMNSIIQVKNMLNQYSFQYKHYAWQLFDSVHVGLVIRLTTIDNVF